MTPSNILFELADRYYRSNKVAYWEVRAVSDALIEGKRPTPEAIERFKLCFDRDPVLDTLDGQEFMEWLNNRSDLV